MEPKMGVALIVLCVVGLAGWWVVAEDETPPPPPPPVVQEIDPDKDPDFTPTLLSKKDQKALDAFRAKKQQSHASVTQALLAAENYWGPDYCGENRNVLRDALTTYAKTRSEDFHAAISGKMMTRSEMNQLWGSPDDKLALHQANDRLHTGVLIQADFLEPDSLYLRIYTFSPDVKTACPEVEAEEMAAKAARLQAAATSGDHWFVDR